MKLSIANLIATVALCACSTTIFAAEPTQMKLREELLKMAEMDQVVRRDSTKGDFTQWLETDEKNQRRLREIVSEFGWPTISMVGKEGSRAAWLIAQHSDRDRDFQKKVLQLMKPLLKNREVSGQNYAYLYDRTHYPQRFGTQGSCVTREEWQPFEIEDIANVEQRRREISLPSLREYAASFREGCANTFTSLHKATDPRRTVPIPQSNAELPVIQ